jgi:hypothetical protein
VAHATAELKPVIDRKESFDPFRTERRFVIGATDYMTAILASPLLRKLSYDAPWASADFVPQPIRDGALAPHSQLDLIVGPAGFNLPGRSQELFTDDFVLIADAEKAALAVPETTVAQLSALPHAIAYPNNPNHDHVHDLLRPARIDYIVGARLFGLAALPLLVPGNDMVALLPRMLATKASRTLRLWCSSCRRAWQY